MKSLNNRIATHVHCASNSNIRHSVIIILVLFTIGILKSKKCGPPQLFHIYRVYIKQKAHVSNCSCTLYADLHTYKHSCVFTINKCMRLCISKGIKCSKAQK